LVFKKKEVLNFYENKITGNCLVLSCETKNAGKIYLKTVPPPLIKSKKKVINISYQQILSCFCCIDGPISGINSFKISINKQMRTKEQIKEQAL